MDAAQFRKHGHEMIEYIADFLETEVHKKPVLAQVKPGYLLDQLPKSAPEEPDTYENVMKDFEQMVMPGITHWQGQGFFAYYPARTSYASMLGDMLSSALNPIGFSWVASPACTELEMGVMDWLGKAVGLPPTFLFEGGTNGGGVIQGTASEAALSVMLAARTRVINRYKQESKEIDFSKLVCYSSTQAHSSTEKGALITGWTLRLLEPDENMALTAKSLAEAMSADIKLGLIPAFVLATCGTTPTCAFDQITEIAQVCLSQSPPVWFHVDAAYAGPCMLCPEFRHLFSGVELADSFNFNCHKNMLVNFDCSALWVKNKDELINAFNLQPEYLPKANDAKVTDYRHWHIPLGRRFRSLKLWFTMRIYGLKGLQFHIRQHVNYAKLFETELLKDDRFEVVFKRELGLICFRIKGENNNPSKKLLEEMNTSGKYYLIGAHAKEMYFIRVSIANVQSEDFIHETVGFIRDATTKILANLQ